MKKIVLSMFVAMLALTVGVGSVASAGADGGSQVAAKKGKKGCKKGKGKAGKSAATSAKKKGKGCKGKGKGKGKTEAPTTPTAPTVPGWPPADGVYSDNSTSTEMVLSAGATKAQINIVGNGTCMLVKVSNSSAASTTVTATTLTAGTEETRSIAGFTTTLKWNLELTTDLKYKITADTKFEALETDPCNKPGVVISGVFTKAA